MTQQQTHDLDSDPPTPFANFKNFTEQLLKVKKDKLQTQRREKKPS